jgi:DNA-binding MarR family transcriptional regulator
MPLPLPSNVPGMAARTEPDATPRGVDDHETSLLYVIGRVNQGIRREMRSRLAHWSLSVQEFTTLSVLASRPGLSNAQLARRSLVTPQSMIEILSKLEERGLVRREVDPSHGRILRADLTKAGRQMMSEAGPAIQEIQDGMLLRVSARQQETTMTALRSAMESLSRHSDRPD